MKRSVLVLTLAAVLVVAFAGAAFAKTPVTTPGISSGGGVGTQAWRNLFSGPYNPGFGTTLTVDSTFENLPTTGFAGYLRWDASANGSGAEVWSGDGSTSPHGNYTTTTNKCAVCHSVHQATVGGTVLTAWEGVPVANRGGTGSTDVRARASSSCIFCHGQNATFTPVRVNNLTATSITPHSYCARCHTVSPHGAGASEFPVLAQKLIHDGADANINTDAAKLTAATGLATNELLGFAGSAANRADGVVLGTGYLCGYCHSGAAFAVPVAGYSPTAGGYAGPVNEGITFANTGFTKAQDQMTGHRVLAEATSSWNATVTAGNRLPDGTIAATDTPNPFRVAQFAPDWTGDRTIAWAPANSCQACHAARTFWGQPAFPHNYVNNVGQSVARLTTTTPGLGSSYVWLTSAGDADDAQEIVVGTRAGTPHNAEPLTRDGLCLKCHVAGDGSAGVGINY
ncbi:MAG: hypothetical protein KGZ40_01035 [Clostridiales bacterium]|nr:hypothetical protein [Clostridiales bacterium]